MGTLSSELGAHFDRGVDSPRVYVDANVPARMVDFMRQRLSWDTLFVIEHDELRRAPDVEHFRRARDMRRTLISLDHDYFDDERFPPAQSGGVVVIAAVNERAFRGALRRIDREWFRVEPTPAPTSAAASAALPLAGRKLLLHG
ncbi:MAG: DUF5615 family PIN-like protein [Vicinamibacterales bacterium]